MARSCDSSPLSSNYWLRSEKSWRCGRQSKELHAAAIGGPPPLVFVTGVITNRCAPHLVVPRRQCLKTPKHGCWERTKAGRAPSKINPLSQVIDHFPAGDAL